MLAKYRPNIESLSPEAAGLVATALSRRYPDREFSADALFDSCAAAGVDQADVVCSLATDPSPLAVVALETVVGKPIEVGHPCLAGPPEKKREEPVTKMQRARASSPRSSGGSDPRKIAFVAPNPKKPGSASFDRFAKYEVGMTVDQAVAAGVSRADIKWDSERSFIKFEE